MTKDYNDLTFTDDFMFCKILKNNQNLAKQLVELILDVTIKDIKRLETQHSIEDSTESRGIRLDVYLEDDEDTVYDIEMQTYDEGDLAMRTRYYHSLIAVENLNKGADYSDMKHSYVIFICNFDPFKLGSPKYTERNRFDEHPNALIEDGAVSIFLNCTSQSSDLSPEMQSFFKYIHEKSPSEGLTKSIENDLVEAKKQQKWRREYMDLNQIKRKERSEGRAEGHAIMLTKNIDHLVKSANVSAERACEMLGVTLEEYEQAKELIH